MAELSFEWDCGRETLEIHGDRDGLLFLAAKLKSLADRAAPDHEHLMSAEWGGPELSGELVNAEATKVPHVIIALWPDDNGAAK